MDIQATKIELAQKLLSETSEVVLQKIKDILTKENTDWWDELSIEEKAEIEEGIAQADRGETIPHDEVRQKIREKYGL
jgi:predicted transcriptional regulator